MKSQIIQNVFKLMLGTSALLVSVAFFIRTISPAQATPNSEILLLPSSSTIPYGTIVGCGSGIYQYQKASGSFGDGWRKIGG
jgi:hypothetical protein